LRIGMPGISGGMGSMGGFARRTLLAASIH
jgi:hypothetical protein